jgi:hypothetical protein
MLLKLLLLHKLLMNLNVSYKDEHFSALRVTVLHSSLLSLGHLEVKH